MASAVKPTRTEREEEQEESCFSRAAREIRRVLSRICRSRSSSSPDRADIPPHPQSDFRELFKRKPLRELVSDNSSQPDQDQYSEFEYECSSPDQYVACSAYGPLFVHPSLPFPITHQPQKRIAGSPINRKNKIHKKDSFASSSSDSSLIPSCYVNLQLMAQTAASTDQDETRAAPSTDLHSDSCLHREEDIDESSGGLDRADPETQKHGRACFPSLPLSDSSFHPPNRKDSDDGGTRFNSTSTVQSVDQSVVQSVDQSVDLSPCVRGGPTVIQDWTGGSRTSESVQSDSDAQVEMEVTAVICSVSKTQSAQSDQRSSGWRRTDSSCRPRSNSWPSLSQITPVETRTGAGSLVNMLLNTSFQEFTPDDGLDESYRFQSSGPGLYQCSVTGLVFHMEGEGLLVYRTVPWSRRLLVQHHKRPAGPLFDISCEQRSVCRLHLPHSEIRSTGGADFLSVAHVTDEGIDFISPHQITETHLIINITAFSAFGNVKDEDSPAVPVRALVLLFYRPPADPDPESLLNVLLLPKNVVLGDVLRFRKKLSGDEIYIETSPHCKLHPQQEYSLSNCPEDDSVLVQPTEAEFDCDNYDNYFPAFQVSWETVMKHIKLFLRDTKISKFVWERRVCLSSIRTRRSAPSLLPRDRLLDVRSSFIDGISGPVLQSLLDKLLEKTVITDAERESADVVPNQRDRARLVIDTVRKKGHAASSEMIEFLCEADPFHCQHLGLI